MQLCCGVMLFLKSYLILMSMREYSHATLLWCHAILEKLPNPHEHAHASCGVMLFFKSRDCL